MTCCDAVPLVMLLPVNAELMQTVSGTGWNWSVELACVNLENQLIPNPTALNCSNPSNKRCCDRIEHNKKVAI